MTEPVPVTLITGFLGAGKTTLLNHLLRTQSARRFAIIENEYGDLGLDGELLGTEDDLLFELTDGCVCCSVRDDFLAVLDGLVDQVGMIDHVVVETTGLASPGPVMRAFDRPSLRGKLELCGVVAVVDAAQLAESLDDSDTCADQIACADLLILNKSDQVGVDALARTRARLAELNPLAQVVCTTHARVDGELVLAAHNRTLAQGPDSHTHGHGHAHQEHDHKAHGHDAHEHHAHEQDGHSHGEHRHSAHGPGPALHADSGHDPDIQAVSVESDGVVDIEALDRWLGSLVRNRARPMLRMKGVIGIEGGRRFVFHAVRRTIDVRPADVRASESGRNRVVFIGRNLDAAALRAGFATCLRGGVS